MALGQDITPTMINAGVRFLRKWVLRPNAPAPRDLHWLAAKMARAMLGKSLYGPDDEAIAEAKRLLERGIVSPFYFAREGEWVCCEGGHQIGKVRHDVVMVPAIVDGVSFGLSDLTDWFNTENHKRPNDRLEFCTKCGARFRSIDQGTWYFEDGWRRP